MTVDISSLVVGAVFTLQEPRRCRCIWRVVAPAWPDTSQETRAELVERRPHDLQGSLCNLYPKRTTNDETLMRPGDTRIVSGFVVVDYLATALIELNI